MNIEKNHIHVEQCDMSVLVATHIQSVAYQQAGLDSAEDIPAILLLEHGISVKCIQNCGDNKKKNRRSVSGSVGLVGSLCCLLAGFVGVVCLLNLKIIPMEGIRKKYIQETKCKILEFAKFDMNVSYADVLLYVNGNWVEEGLKVENYPQPGLLVSCYVLKVRFQSLAAGSWQPGLVVDTFTDYPHLSAQCHDNITNATPISPAPLTPDTDRRRHSHGYSLLKGHVYPCFKSKAEQMNQTRIRLKQDLSRLHNFYQDFGHRLLLMFVPSLLFILGFVGVFFSAIHIQVD